MPHHFQGWKRKLGVLTLVMACALVIGWVRSLYVADQLWISVPPLFPEIVCGDGSVLVGVAYRKKREPPPLKLNWGTADYEIINNGYLNDVGYDWWVWNGFGVATGRKAVRVVVPYWSIVLPLTALSAWLLLSKQNKRAEHA